MCLKKCTIICSLRNKTGTIPVSWGSQGSLRGTNILWRTGGIQTDREEAACALLWSSWVLQCNLNLQHTWFTVSNGVLTNVRAVMRIEGLLEVKNKNRTPGLPWWCSGWESTCQCRGHGFKPWSGKIPHAAEQLGPWATTTEPARLELVLCNKRGHDSERPTHRDEEWPPLAATRESPRTETKAQHSQK